MTGERIYLYDTTLRDGAQTQGIDFNPADKAAIARELDRLGIDYIEGGWPGANPTDDAFFKSPPALRHARIAAFGMTRRSGRSASNDPGLAATLGSGAKVACLVGKTWDFHVETALGVSLAENIEMIADSIAVVTQRLDEAIFDAEHFFDGYKANPGFALDCLKAAHAAGARAGARQVQGTLNGLGERCGNANLVSLIPSLVLKMGFATGVTPEGMRSLTHVSRLLDERLNRAPNRHAAYVGEAAFTHKAGLHVSAVEKDPRCYEHIDPELVGNRRHVIVSDQAGRANLVARLRELDIEVDAASDRLGTLLELVKSREFAGYAYDGAEASFELLARRALGEVPDYFRLTSFRVIDERRWNARGELVTLSEATIKVEVGGR